MCDYVLTRVTVQITTARPASILHGESGIRTRTPGQYSRSRTSPGTFHHYAFDTWVQTTTKKMTEKITQMATKKYKAMLSQRSTMLLSISVAMPFQNVIITMRTRVNST